MVDAGERHVIVGRIAGIFGVKGWLRVFSHTNPRENILRYGPWLVGDDSHCYVVTEGMAHGRGIVAHLQGIDDREAARSLIGSPIRVPRERLGEPVAGQYYWFDLIGLDVVTDDGHPLGRVAELLETGANDVLVVVGDRRRLVPFVRGAVVKHVDLEARLIRVAWDPDF